MGLFISYCKRCNNKLGWFLDCEKGIRCRCGYLNTMYEVIDSLNNEDCWIKYRRKQKLEKICSKKES